ncbi:hypothetical protein FQA39_LY19188 [Lamprigera yunnana]|nr:hypothetical protein FQA39_LY19188 [Lamprigera yunnana]
MAHTFNPLIWIETVSNPLLKIADVKATSEIAHRHNILLAVDNSFLTPYLHRPLEFGADIVCQSLSKYLNGHADVIMGALIMNEKEMYDKLNSMQYVIGITPSPFDCSQTIRGLKTLPMRMKLHRSNAIKVAQFLETHNKVIKVIHPHELFKNQTSGHSGLITFYVDGDRNTAKRLLSNFKLITPSSSFGSTESTAEITILTSQSIVPKDSQDINITDNLIRLSVGLEDEEDIIFDLKQALNNI